MMSVGSRGLAAALIPGLVALALAGCASQQAVEAPPPAAAPSAPPPANMHVEDFVGRWGLAAYHREEDRARTEAAARRQCTQPYVITRGPTGGVMMHLADAAQPSEVRLKAGPDGKVYLGPEGAAGDPRDREVVQFDGRVIVLRWVDPEVAGRYGTMIYVRCSAGAPPRTARKKATKKQ